MKKAISFMFLLVAFAFSLHADKGTRTKYILLTGDAVYKYDRKIPDWQKDPLPRNSELSPGDSIKSNNRFSLRERKLFGNVYNCAACPDGCSIPDDIKESGIIDEESVKVVNSIPTGVVIQGTGVFSGKDISCILQTTLQNKDEQDSLKNNLLDVELELYNYTTGKVISEADTVSLKDTICLSIINHSKKTICAYVFWKDERGWAPLIKSNDDSDCCLILKPLSAYVIDVCPTDPVGLQEILILCHEGNQPKDHHIEGIINILNNPTYASDDAMGYTKGFDYKRFELIQ